MGSIFIDTGELRDIARDLRGITGRMAGVSTDMARGAWTTDIGPAAPIYISRITAEQGGVGLLGARVSTHSATLDVEAAARDADEATGGLVAQLTGLGSVNLVPGGLLLAGGAIAGVGGAVSAAGSGLSTFVNTLGEGARSVWGWLTGKADNVATWLKGAVDNTLDYLAGVLTRAGSAMSEALAQIASSLATIGLHVLVIEEQGFIHVFSDSPIFPFAAGLAARYLDQQVAALLTQGQPQANQVFPGDPRFPDNPPKPSTAAGYLGQEVASLKDDTLAITKVSDHPPRFVVELRGINANLGADHVNSLAVAEYELRHGSGPYSDAIIKAIEKAVPPPAQLMFVGHSEGGIAAINVAANANFQQHYQVTHIITAGSPIGSNASAIGNAKVLALQNDGDLVPQSRQLVADAPHGGNVTTEHFTNTHSLNPFSAAHDIQGNYDVQLEVASHSHTEFFGGADGANAYAHGGTTSFYHLEYANTRVTDPGLMA